MKNTRAGFTLIELLVVIAIIAILAAILFPVFAQAREKARQASCTSNLKQDALGLMMYSQDYDESFPTSWAKGFPGDPMFFVQPYLKSVQVLQCPTKKISTSAANGVCGLAANDDYGSWDLAPGGRDNPTGEATIWGYGFNQGITWNDGTGLIVQSGTPAPNGNQTVTLDVLGKQIPVVIRPYPRVGQAHASIASPAQIFLAADTNEPPLASITLNALRPGNFPGYTDTRCESLLRANTPRHSKGYVFAYADGHVKQLHYDGGVTNYGDPASVSDLCSYYRDYDGGNSPGNCKTKGFAP